MIGNIVPQNEWEAARLGKITASHIRKILVQPKTKAAREAGEISETLSTYLIEKITEIATGTSRQVSTFATEWGEEHEPAGALYIKERYPDFVYLGKNSPRFFDYSDFSGGSPDGYSEAARLIGEVKCPENPANHTLYAMMESQADLFKHEPDYYCQLQFNMMSVAKFFGWDFEETKGLFISYCPLYTGRFETLQYKELLIAPDMELYKAISGALPMAERMLAAAYSKLLGKATNDPILITGDNINGTSVLLAE